MASAFVGESMPVVNIETSYARRGDVVDLFQLYLSTQTRVTDLERV